MAEHVPEVELVYDCQLTHKETMLMLTPELSMATGHLNINEEANHGRHEMISRHLEDTESIEERAVTVVSDGVQPIRECLRSAFCW